MTKAEKNQTLLYYVIFASIISICNIIFLHNYMVSLGVVVVELGILAYLFIKNKIAEYICMLLFFVSNCIEFSVFANDSEVYNFKNFRVFGINLALIAMVPLIVYGIFNYKQIIKQKNTLAGKFFKSLITINVIALIIGALLIITNNNNIRSVSGLGMSFIQKIYAMVAIPLAFGASLMVLSSSKKNRDKFSIALQAVLMSNIIQMAASLLFGITGSYGYLTTMQNSVLSFLAPFLILAWFDKENIVCPRITTVVGFIGIALLLLYNPNGKIIIISVLAIGLFLFLLIKKSTPVVQVAALVVIAAGIIILPFVVQHLRENPLFDAKFKDVIALINVFSSDWLENLPQSPRVRIEEFRDIFVEFKQNPLFAIFGKGYLGSILDHTGYFEENIISADGFVSEAEWDAHIYFSLHEGSSFLITYGLVGVVVMIHTIIVGLKQYRQTKNYLILIGIYWFILFYGYSITISCFGFTALFFGLVNSDRRVVKNTIKDTVLMPNKEMTLVKETGGV